MNQRRAVDKFHRHGGTDESIGLGRRHARGQEYEQRPQALAARRDRLTGMMSELGTMTSGKLAHPVLDAIHETGDLHAPGIDDGPYDPGDHGRSCTGPRPTTPTCKAMMPPAVSE